jgi:hypothetical protein
VAQSEAPVETNNPVQMLETNGAINERRTDKDALDGSVYLCPEPEQKMRALVAQLWRYLVMSNVSMFFAGVGTTALLLGAGFGGGLMLARTAMEPASQTRATAADRLPPARVVLPASGETASAPSEAAPSAASAPQQQAPSQVIPAKELLAVPTEQDRRADRAEQRSCEPRKQAEHMAAPTNAAT